MRSAWLLLAISMAGCAETDPYERPGMWQPEGANAGNMAAMIERPADLRRGRGDPGATRVESQLAVARIWEGHERPLLNDAGAQTAAPPTGAPPAVPPAPAPPPGAH